MTIKRIKLIRLMLYRFLAGNPHPPDRFIAMIDGLPKVLPFKRQIRKGSIKHIRLVTTLLSYSRWILWWGNPDYEPMTTPPTKPNTGLGIELGAIYSMIWNFPIRSTWSSFHRSGSKGPMGQAMVSSQREISLLPDWLKTDLKTFGGEAFSERLDLLLSDLPENNLEIIQSWEPYKGSPTLRRISHVKDIEGKLRVIGIFDYWSQTVLKPLHDSIFKILKHLPNDCTYNQGKFTKDFGSGPYYCFDLTKATDRFPLEVQVDFLSSVIGRAKADAWGRIMTQLEFDAPDGTKVKYQCGQPMGAYSSWGVFTLCHHLVVQCAALRAGKPPGFTGYWLLGDDIVIQGSDVAKQYKDIILSLGVEISEQKTIESKDSFEFAKRFFFKGQEVTSYPTRALQTTQNFYSEVWSVLENSRGLGWDTECLTPADLKKLYIALGKTPGWAGRIANKHIKLGLLGKILRSIDPIYNSWEFNRRSGLNLSCNQIPRNLEFLLEVAAALRLQSIQDSFQATYQEINVLRKELLTLYMQAGSALRVDNFPILSTFVEKANTLVQEGRKVSEIVQNQSWLDILHLPFDWLPDPRRIITGRVTNRQALLNAVLASKTSNFIRDEAKARLEELSGD